jgi:hypothetical protein
MKTSQAQRIGYSRCCHATAAQAFRYKDILEMMNNTIIIGKGKTSKSGNVDDNRSHDNNSGSGEDHSATDNHDKQEDQVATDIQDNQGDKVTTDIQDNQEDDKTPDKNSGKKRKTFHGQDTQTTEGDIKKQKGTDGSSSSSSLVPDHRPELSNKK